MVFSASPLTAFADDSVYTGGLCEHHTEHNEECGYIEAAEESPCTHEHTEECYRLVTDCVHEHTEECYLDGTLPAEGEEKTADACAHVCSEESGCVTKELDCEHDDECGYVPAKEGNPCGYWCGICAGETEKSDKTDVTDEIEETDEIDKTEEIDETDETDETEESEKSFSPMSAMAITPEKPDNGDGTEGEPYQISTAAELYWFAGLVNGTLEGERQNTAAYAILTEDITLNKDVLDDGNLNNGTFEQWTPIGEYGEDGERAYTGTFDGNGKTISGLYIDSDDGYIGLFGYIGSGATVKNVGIVDSYVNGTGEYPHVGGVSGGCNGRIENCYNKGTVSGSFSVGGISGSSSGSITNCYNTGTVSSSGLFAGGICGQNMNTGKIDRCYNTGAVTGTCTGGVCGYNDEGEISNCYNTGAVSGAGISYVGGVCGYNMNPGKIENCYNTGIVSGSSSTNNDIYAGGVCGISYGTVTNCYNTGAVSSTGTVSGTYAGGVCGRNLGGTVENCYYLEGSAASDSGEVALTEYQFGLKDKFSGWNFENVWKMDIPLGRPTLTNNKEESPEDCGDGTKDNPYLISNAGQLAAFARVVNDGKTDICAKLTEDIVIQEGVLKADGSLNGDGSDFEQWTPIGEYGEDGERAYTGIFDGNGKTISGLYIDSNADYIGLFGYIGSGAEVKDVGIENSYINCRGGMHTGGICGYSYGGTIENCYNTGTVSGNYAGGVCGISYGTVENCYNTGTVSGTDASFINYVGGICGRNMNDGTIENCYNTGTVSGRYAGGVCGINYTTVTNCYNTGTVSGEYAGGVCGNNMNPGKIDRCYNTGTVSGTMFAGGVCGYNSGTVENCYNTGAVSGTTTGGSNYAGGVCGYNMNTGTIENCYNTGAVSSTGAASSNYAGGVCGWNLGSPVKNCYYLEGLENTDDTSEEKTAAEFLSGEVAWLLQNSQEEQVWGQKIGTDELPRLSYNKDDKVCKVTFMNGGDEVKTVYINMGKTIEEPDIDVGSGFYVDGWYTDSDLDGDEWDFENDTIDDDITLYADVEERRSSGGGSYSLSEGIDRDEPEEQPEYRPDEPSTPETPGFIDVDIFDWYHDGVMYVTENGIMNGVGGNRFEPETELKREMLAVILWNMTDNPEPNGIAPFLDVTSDKYYAKAIAWANENGVMYGYGEEFGVGEAVTREDFAAILYRYAAFKGYDTTQGGMAIREFIDFEQIADYAVEALGWAVNSGIISGMGDGTISPKTSTYRGQAAVMLMKFCENIMK